MDIDSLGLVLAMVIGVTIVDGINVAFLSGVAVGLGIYSILAYMWGCYKWW